MKMHPYPVALALMLSLAGCQQASEYTKSEAPNRLKLDETTLRTDLRFAPGSSQLAGSEIARLRALAASGRISAADRVLVSVGGSPDLAAARAAAISEELLPYGIVTSPAVLANMPRDRAVVAAERYLVTLPPCPNWSSPPAHDFTNMQSSNLGCATASNLGRMVASPADLASGQPLGLAAGKPARDAVRRYLFDIDPMGTGIKPLAGGAAAPAAAGGGAGAGGAGASAGGAGGSTGATTGSE